MKKYWIVPVVLGILLMSYPFLDRTYTWYKQNKAFKEINEIDEIDIVNNKETVEAYRILDDIFEFKINGKNNKQEKNIQSDIQQNTDEKKDKRKSTIGVLKIEKINLKIPILYGASHGNLKTGAAQIAGTSPIGEIGNTALAAHRSHTYGRLFNRLNELKEGDEIIIESGESAYKYEVYKKSIVEPDDITVLYRNKKDKILTLITCDPMYNPTHRLVVQCIQK